VRDKPRSSYLSDGGSNEEWIELEFAERMNLDEIWVYNWNDGEGREADRFDIDISATNTGGLVGDELSDFGTPASGIDWTTVADDFTANNGDPLGRVKGRIPDWGHTFSSGTQSRYLRLNQLVNTDNNASTGLDDQAGLGGILIFGSPVPEPSTALMLAVGLLGLASCLRRR